MPIKNAHSEYAMPAACCGAGNGSLVAPLVGFVCYSVFIGFEECSYIVKTTQGCIIRLDNVRIIDDLAENSLLRIGPSIVAADRLAQLRQESFSSQPGGLVSRL